MPSEERLINLQVRLTEWVGPSLTVKGLIGALAHDPDLREDFDRAVQAERAELDWGWSDDTDLIRSKKEDEDFNDECEESTVRGAHSRRSARK